MNKKGFTLVELIAIIALLAMITAIAVPNIKKEVTQNETQQNKVKNETIENAVKIYASKYYADRLAKKKVNCNIYFTFEQMEKDGLISIDDLECKGDNWIGVEFLEGSAKYYTDADCYQGSFISKPSSYSKDSFINNNQCDE